VLEFIHRMRLKTKIFMACVSIVILLIVSSSILLYTYVTQQITRTFYDNSTDVLVQTSNYMDERLKSTLGRINAMRLNGNFDKTMREYLYYNDSYLNAAAISQFSESFAEIRGSDTFSREVYVVKLCICDEDR
jgi:hypothetical protein